MVAHITINSGGHENASEGSKMGFIQLFENSPMYEILKKCDINNVFQILEISSEYGLLQSGSYPKNVLVFISWSKT